MCDSCQRENPKYYTKLYFCNEQCQLNFIQGGGEKRPREPTVEDIVITIKTLERFGGGGGNMDTISELKGKLALLITTENAKFVFSEIDPIDFHEFLFVNDDLDLNLLRNLLEEPKFDVNSFYHFGTTILMDVVSKDDSIEGIQMVLNHPKIDVNVQNSHGTTALMIAIEEGSIEGFRLLLRHPNINVNLQNNNGFTALMFAALDDHEREMIELGGHPDTDFFIRGATDETAFEMCSTSMCKLLMYAMIRNQRWDILPSSISKMINLRRLRNHLCENLSHDGNLGDLVVLARLIRLPIAPNATKATICRDVSTVLSTGFVYDEISFNAQRSKERGDTRNALSVLDAFKRGLEEILGMDTQGKTIEQLLEELYKYN